MDPNASLSILRMGGLKTMKNKSCSFLRLQFGTSAENDLSFIAVPNYVWITDLVTITWKKKWNGQNIFSWPSQVLYHCTLVSSFKFHLDLKTGYAWLEASHWNDTIKVCHFCCDKEENEVVIITFSVIADIRYDFFLFIFWEKITREGESYLNLRTMLEKCYKRHKLIVKKINLDTEARKPYFKIVKWWSNQESAVGGTKLSYFSSWNALQAGLCNNSTGSGKRCDPVLQKVLPVLCQSKQTRQLCVIISSDALTATLDKFLDLLKKEKRSGSIKV